jgi:hypothetical protein
MASQPTAAAPRAIANFTASPQSRSDRSSHAGTHSEDFRTTFRNQLQRNDGATEPTSDDTQNPPRQSGRSEATSTSSGDPQSLTTPLNKEAAAYSNITLLSNNLPDTKPAIFVNTTPQSEPISNESLLNKITASRAPVTAKPEAQKTSPQKELSTLGSDPTDLAQLSIIGRQAAQSSLTSSNALDESEAHAGKSASTRVDETDPTAGPQQSSPPNSITGDLAVAMKITQANSDPESQCQADNSTSAASQLTGNLHNPAQANAAPEASAKHDPGTSQTLTTAPVSQSQTSIENAKSGKTEESPAAQPADFESEFNRARAEPVRGAHVQITSADNQRVDIRLQERGGTLSVSVRSGDANLTRTLQEHAPELTSRLSTEHYRTELWTPNSSRNSSEQGNTGSGSPNQNRENSNQRDSNQRQNNKQNQNPEWIEEFENHPTAFQKRIEYTWLQ